MERLGVADNDNLNESEAGQDCSLGCGRCERDIKRDIPFIEPAGLVGKSRAITKISSGTSGTCPAGQQGRPEASSSGTGQDTLFKKSVPVPQTCPASRPNKAREPMELTERQWRT